MTELPADAAPGLDNIRLLERMAPEERARLARACRFRRYSPGEQIIDCESDSRDIFFVVQGQVRVVNYSLSGREVALDDIEAGGYFGELAALDGSPRSATVVARTEAITAACPPEAFVEAAIHNPDMAHSLMRGLAQIIRRSTDRIMDLSTLGSNNRVHAEVLRLARHAMDDPHAETAVIDPLPSHSDIASRVSTTRETVARVLNDLARQGVVKREKNTLHVLDVGRLEEMVENVRG